MYFVMSGLQYSAQRCIQVFDDLVSEEKSVGFEDDGISLGHGALFSK